MAEGGCGKNNDRMMEVRGMGRAQMLLQVTEDVRRRGRKVRDLPPHQFQ